MLLLGRGCGTLPDMSHSLLWFDGQPSGDSGTFSEDAAVVGIPRSHAAFCLKDVPTFIRLRSRNDEPRAEKLRILREPVHDIMYKGLNREKQEDWTSIL